jgi:MoxR-like ATPase
MPDTGPSLGRTIYRSIADNIEKVMHGQSRAIRLALAGFAGGGHILLEDCPGTGKTTLAKTLALSIDIAFKRIQFTPDLLPSDITGVSIFDPKDQVFRFHKGPIFTNILLVDEINRASPRTQSALLEAMAERQVSIDGQLHLLENPFLSSRRRIRRIPMAPIRCRKGRWIVSRCNRVWDMSPRRKRSPS